MATYRILSFDDRYRVDHAVLQETDNDVAPTTVCGRKLRGSNWFLRGHHEFNPTENFNCKRCCAVLKTFS